MHFPCQEEIHFPCQEEMHFPCQEEMCSSLSMSGGGVCFANIAKFLRALPPHHAKTISAAQRDNQPLSIQQSATDELEISRNQSLGLFKAQIFDIFIVKGQFCNKLVVGEIKYKKIENEY